MTWPTRIGMPGGIRTALDESAARWSVDELARPEVQRRALEDAGRNVAGLRDLLGEVTETVHRSGAVLVAGFPHGSSALVVFAAALGEVNATYNGPAPGGWSTTWSRPPERTTRRPIRRTTTRSSSSGRTPSSVCSASGPAGARTG